MLIKSDKNEISSYFSDAANFKGFAEKVYIPEKREEIPVLLKECFESRISVHISGMGTGLTGGRVPEGGIVISTERLNRILEVDVKNKTVSVESGVILQGLHRKLDEYGLYYPPDPTEQISSIGGNIANNASGAKTFKYGPTRDYIFELEIALPDGEVLSIKREKIFEKDGKIVLKSNDGKIYTVPVCEINMPKTKNASGYFLKKGMDAIDLFIGAEGTLGCILSAKLRVLAKPEHFLSMILFFNSENNALGFVKKIREESRSLENKNIDALAIEFFDSNSLDFLREDFPKIPEGNFTAVWVEQEIENRDSELVLESYILLMEEFGVNSDNVWFADNASDRREFIMFRHAVSQKVSDFISVRNIRKVGTDLAVPDNHFREFYFCCRKTVADSGLNFITYGHFGNSHIHLNMLPEGEAEFQKAKSIYKILCQEAARLGGTISAEHGIGKIKREYLKLMYSEQEINNMRNVKLALDRNNILSPGNIFG